MASRQTLGLLSLGHPVPDSFTQEHLRLTKSVAIPAAAAIQNARLYECANIYGAEFEKWTLDLQKAESALNSSRAIVLPDCAPKTSCISSFRVQESAACVQINPEQGH